MSKKPINPYDSPIETGVADLSVVDNPGVENDGRDPSYTVAGNANAAGADQPSKSKEKAKDGWKFFRRDNPARSR